jgi:hypothetical protein
MTRVRAFQKPFPPAYNLTIDRAIMNEIRDTANRLWQETHKPNANLIMFEALKQVMSRHGAIANFTVPDMETK